MTHCERVLDVLADGEPHSHHELYALNVIAHSRVADLRRKGHTITHRRDGDTSYYQLVGSLGEQSSPPEPSAYARPDQGRRHGPPLDCSPNESDDPRPPTRPDEKPSLSFDSSGEPSTTTGAGRCGSPEQLSFEVAA